MTHLRCSALVPAVLLVLGGCGGGDSTVTTIPVGVYAGTGTFAGSQVINGQTIRFSTAPFLLGIVTASGSYQLLSYSSGSPAVVSQIDVGPGALSAGSFVSSADLEYGLYPNYNSNDFPRLFAAQGGALSASIALHSTLSGAIVYPGLLGDVLTFPLSYAAASTTPATLAAVARSYSGAFYSNVNTGVNDNLSATSTFSISSSGALTGTVACPFGSISPPPNPAPCTVSGTLTARADLNAWDVSISFANGTGMSYPSSWVGKTATGLGYYDAASGKLMFAAVAPDNTAFAFSN